MKYIDEDDPVSDINITPFVDILLVLLVVFMITAPIVTLNLPVDLPEGKPVKSKKPEASEAVIITLLPDERVFLNDAPIKSETLISSVDSLLVQSGRSTPVYIQADKSIFYGKVAEVMGELAAKNISNVSLVLEKN